MSSPQRIVIANFTTGLETYNQPFLIDNTSFPVLQNAYSWRGQVLRKRGTSLLGRLCRKATDLILSTQANGATYTIADLLNDSSTGTPTFRFIAPNATVAPGSLSVTVGAYTFSDFNKDANLIQDTGPAYVTAITGITQAASAVVNFGVAHNFSIGQVVYIQGVLGMTQINDAYYTITAIGATTITLNVDSTAFTAYTGGGTAKRISGSINYATGAMTINFTPILVGPTDVHVTYDYCPGLPVMGLEDFENENINFPILVALDTRYSYQFNQGTNKFFDVSFYKANTTPKNALRWNGGDFQQFFSTNYAGAMWASQNVPGMQLKKIDGQVTVLTPTTATIGITGHGLLVRDFIWVNEVQGLPTVNGLTGQVTIVNNVNLITVEFPDGALVGGPSTANTGIAQYLTNTTLPAVDGIRWYDGTGSNLGWVNFAPPLQKFTEDPPIPLLTPEYLVGALAIVVFKDRLLFFSPFIQTSASALAGNLPILYQDRVVYSQNGTPYYFGNVNNFTSTDRIIPTNQTYNVESFYQNIIGRGGFLDAGVAQQFIGVGSNQDVLITAFEKRQMKLIYTSNDVLPFLFQSINSELGTESTFSTIRLDTGLLGIGDYGITMTTQVSCQRIDLQIPDQVFDIKNDLNGNERVTAIRDFRNEWVYFTYPQIDNSYRFPTKTLFYNYRENNFATFEENYTHYGTFRKTSKYTWGSIGQEFPTWQSWNKPWNFGKLAARYPDIIGGNQQGYVMKKDAGTAEAPSGYIQNIVGNTITSPDHCLAENDWITITDSTGVTNLNGMIVRVKVVDINTFTISKAGIGTYTGGGQFTRLANFFIQTKEFPPFWGGARRARIGTQRYLFETTAQGELTASLFLSQNSDYPVTAPPPVGSASNIFSNIVLTHPEPDNSFSANQSQIWHRSSNSFIGDSVQIGFSLSDVQMQNPAVNVSEVVLHAIAIDMYPGPILY